MIGSTKIIISSLASKRKLSFEDKNVKICKSLEDEKVFINLDEEVMEESEPPSWITSMTKSGELVILSVDNFIPLYTEMLVLNNLYSTKTLSEYREQRVKEKWNLKSVVILSPENNWKSLFPVLEKQGIYDLTLLKDHSPQILPLKFMNVWSSILNKISELAKTENFSLKNRPWIRGEVGLPILIKLKK